MQSQDFVPLSKEVFPNSALMSEWEGWENYLLPNKPKTFNLKPLT